MARPVRIRGAAQTEMGGRAAPAQDLARTAAQGALDDADLRARDLALVVFTNALGGDLDQEMVRGQSWLRPLGLDGVPVINVENACAGGVSALAVAQRAAEAGPVLVVGAETMWHAARAEVAPRLVQGVAAADRPALVEAADGGAPLMEQNGRRAAELLAEGLATIEHLAAVVVKSSRLAAANPRAARRTALTAEQVRAARVVTGPLTRPMCCSYTDGAAAVVLDRAPGGPALRTVQLTSGDGARTWFSRFRALAQRTWEAAGIDPADLDLVELHDVTAAEELASLEALGLFAPGRAGPATLAGATDVGGAGPTVNPSGGLLGRGHPLAATGLAQVVEVVDQVRGRCGDRQVADPAVGATVNMGGIVGGEPALVGMTVITRT
ncbi:thiolase family protein [Iamia majanohamensis]|uniref:Thiolase family protein n=1 Tax=Iamia majanohamensis TaxID=467976 RepID=A0AAE9Y3L0_9ACTN|nr:thiolase family protein [Iamia majanohamensis]WCO65870.1 thiolase family protein [Iamia majanohamensis]